MNIKYQLYSTAVGEGEEGGEWSGEGGAVVKGLLGKEGFEMD